MKLKVLFLFTLTIITFGLSLSAQASPPNKRYDKGTNTCRNLGFDSGWWGKGNDIFKARCKTCHTRTNQVGATFLHSESKSPTGWNRVFYRKRAKCYKAGHWTGLSLDDQLLLNDYLYRFGANTYDPNDAERCG